MAANKYLENKQYFSHPLSELIYYRTYARWQDQLGRREIWGETVARYTDFMRLNLGKKLSDDEYLQVQSFILNQKVMPSMRLLWTAGEAAHKNHIAGYNCAFIVPQTLQDFAEIMYLLMSGTGVGFSVEGQHLAKLPVIKAQTGQMQPTLVIEDNREAWCQALSHGLKCWYEGHDLQFDYHKIRPMGSRLKTFGGTSSGPIHLKSLLDFCREKILKSANKKLSSIDVHDIICKIGECISMGGARRSALISLSDLHDEKIKQAKQGNFYIEHPERAMANNSAIYNHKPSAQEFLAEWKSLVSSQTGERGIFNRGGLEQQSPKRRWPFLQTELDTTGTNPCGEIILRSKQFCNLSEVIARHDDSEYSLLEKVKIASLIGTYQATLTQFPFLSKTWQNKCEEERLLGVSITGFWDSSIARNTKIMAKLKEHAIQTNKFYAKRFGIREATAVTCVKPSGTVSLLVNSSAGVHPRFSKYYLRRVRISSQDPLCKMLIDQGVPHNPEVGQTAPDIATYVFDFPIKAPGITNADNLSAEQQLQFWKELKVYYTEHNPSTTILVEDHEWIKVANWVYENWEKVGGLAFLPKQNSIYKLAPYEVITKLQYQNLIEKLPNLDFSKLSKYEQEDQTLNGPIGCEGESCEFDPEAPKK